jgi:hypothetical protein
VAFFADDLQDGRADAGLVDDRREEASDAFDLLVRVARVGDTFAARRTPTGDFG